MSGACWTIAVASLVLFTLALLVSDAAAHTGAPLFSAVLIGTWGYLIYHHDGRRVRRDRTR